MNMYAVLITLLAGLATVLGALFVRKVRNTSLGAFSLAFATGIMLMLALGELLPEGIEENGIIISLFFLVIGAIFSLVLDLVIPHHHHEDGKEDEVPGHYINDCECAHEVSVSHGMIIALVLHNLLEGLATGATVVSNTRLGINMAFGIAIHNIPIGTTLAVSMLSAGKTRKAALIAATLIGLSQPFGALFGTIAFTSVLTASVLAACNAIVAGILIFISFDELWPAAHKIGNRNLTIAALLIGICFVPVTELLLG